MIYDSVKNLKLYTGLGPGFKEADEFIKANSFEGAAPGRYELPEGGYYMVQNYETRPEDQGFFETHRKYIDLQYVIHGKERHDFVHSAALKEREPYNAEKDVVIYHNGKGGSLTLTEGFFVVYFPEDAHMPNLRTDSVPEKMFKIVFKIPVK